MYNEKFNRQDNIVICGKLLDKLDVQRRLIQMPFTAHPTLHKQILRKSLILKANLQMEKSCYIICRFQANY